MKNLPILLGGGGGGHKQSFPPTVDRTVRKIPGKRQISLQGGGGVPESIYDVTAKLLVWRCHTQRHHDVVLWTNKTTLKWDYSLKIKAWEKSLHSRRDKGIPSSCLWWVTSTTRQASSWISNHGHSDWIPLSLPECSDRFFYSHPIPQIAKLTRHVLTGQIPPATTTPVSWNPIPIQLDSKELWPRYGFWVYALWPWPWRYDLGSRSWHTLESRTTIVWNIIQIQHGSENLWLGHRFWVWVHCDLGLGDMTLG